LKNRSLLLIIGGIGGVTILVCVGCLVLGVIGILLVPTKTASTRPVARATERTRLTEAKPPISTDTPAPTNTPVPTDAPVPTNTPLPTNASTPIPEKPQCKRELTLFDFSQDSLKIVDNVLGNTGCVEYFALYEPQAGRFLVDTGLVISTDVSREQVLQTVYDVNKRLFTGNLGITCIRIFVYPPNNRTIPGVNQALGYDLAQGFSDRWGTSPAQEWWSWLEANRTPSEQISENCEKNHWAQWDNRTQVAPWK